MADDAPKVERPVAIHKPKPWHGVREFLKEYLIIVVGVLTALGAEQGVELLHWRHEAEVARDVFRRDDLRLLAGIGRTDTLGACVDRRLKDLQGVLDKAEASGMLPAVGDIGSGAEYGWFMRGWESAVSSGVLPHLAPGEGARYAAMHVTVLSLGAARDDATTQWATLRSMTGPGRRLSEAEAADLRRALNGSRMEATKGRMLADMLGLMVLDTQLISRPQMLAAWRLGRDRAPSDVCRPIAPWTGASGPTSLAEPATAPEGSYDDKFSAFHDTLAK